MGASITINVDTSGFQEGFDKHLKHTNDLTPLMVDIGELIIAETDDNFAAERSPSGKPWKPSQRAKNEGGKTLTDHRHLRDSIAKKVTPVSVEVGTNKVYAAIHQFGFEGNQTIGAHKRLATQAFGKELKFAVWQSVKQHTRKVSMPVREYLGFNPSIISEIKFNIADYVVNP